MSDFPNDLKYDKKHSWIRIENDIATIGIIKSDADLVKEFVFIQLPEKKEIKKGDTIFSLEAMKWSGEIKTPLSGKIIDVHKELFDDPSIINKDPYGEGWVVKLRFNNDDELNELLSSKEKKLRK